MPIETTLLALPVMDLALLGGLAVFCCLFGWQARRLATRGREAAFQRSLFEAKGAVPQLESAVRQREQQAETLALELKALKARLAEHEVAMRQQESQIAKRDREIRSLNSELTVIKDGGSAGQVLLDGDDDATEPDAADPELAKRYAALEARYEAMKRGMIQRDDRIAELEETLRNPDGEVPTRSLEQELSEIEQTADALKATLKERETQLETLQASLQEEVAQRQALEDLAKRRSEGNRELKATAAKLEQQIPALMQTIESHDAQMAERNARLQAVSGELTGERRTREAREAEIEELQAQLATAGARQRELEQRLQEQDEARRALDSTLADTRDALRATESVVQTQEATIADAEQRLAEAEQRLTAARERAAADQRTAAGLRQAIADRDFRIEGLEAAARQQDAKLETLRETFFEAKQIHKDQINELKARHDAQCQVLDALTTEHDRLRTEATAHDARVARLEQDLAEREDLLATQRSTGRSQADELAASRSELSRAGQTAEALTRQAAELTDALARSHSALRRSQGTALLLIARLGAPTLLLPAPVSPAQKNTNDRTTTFLRHGASSGAVQSMAALWNDQRDTEPSVTES